MSEAPAFHPQPSLPAFLARRPWSVRTIYVVRWLFPLALLAYVGFKLSELGWRDMWAARPGNPGFYVMLVAPAAPRPCR